MVCMIHHVTPLAAGFVHVAAWRCPYLRPDAPLLQPLLFRFVPLFNQIIILRTNTSCNLDGMNQESTHQTAMMLLRVTTNP